MTWRKLKKKKINLFNLNLIDINMALKRVKIKNKN